MKATKKAAKAAEKRSAVDSQRKFQRELNQLERQLTAVLTKRDPELPLSFRKVSARREATGIIRHYMRNQPRATALQNMTDLRRRLERGEFG
jgi:hypothetical protein